MKRNVFVTWIRDDAIFHVWFPPNPDPVSVQTSVTSKSSFQEFQQGILQAALQADPTLTSGDEVTFLDAKLFGRLVVFTLS